MFFINFEEMTNIDWLILITTFFSYVFIYLAVRKNKGRGQSFFTWGMWLVLDIILLIPTIEEGGKSSLMIYASILGSFFISLFLFKLKKIEWEINEWISFALIIAMVVIWYFSKNNDFVIVCGVASQVAAGMPLTVKSWQEPEPKYILGYSFFVLGCIFSLTLEKSAFEKLSLEDHLFPAVLGVQTIAEIIPLVKKLKRK